MNTSLAWCTLWVPGKPDPHNETLFKTTTTNQNHKTNRKQNQNPGKIIHEGETREKMKFNALVVWIWHIPACSYGWMLGLWMLVLFWKDTKALGNWDSLGKVMGL